MTNTTLIAQLREQLPGYPEMRERRDAINAELRRRVTAGATHNYLKTPGRIELERVLAAGEPLDQLDRRIADRIAADQAGAAAREALEGMRDLLTAEIKAAEFDAREVLPLLGAAMAERVREAEQLAPFDQIASPTAAARSKRYADADRLAELLADITALRLEQSRVLRDSTDGWPGKFTILRAIRNPQDVFDDWAVWLDPGYLVHRTDRGRQQLVTPPWPWPLQSAVSTADFSLWCLIHGAQMWIPSPAQYDAAANALRRAAAQPRTTHGRDGEWIDPGPGRDSPARRLARR